MSFCRPSGRVVAAWTKRTVVEDPWFKLAKVICTMHPPTGATRLSVSDSCSCDINCSQKEGYVSRAAYKLKEVQKKHKVIKTGWWGQSHAGR